MNIHIIGGGNLGISLAIGFKKFTKHSIHVTRRTVAQIDHLKNIAISTSSSNIENIEKADIIILTIKPHQTKHVLEELTPFLKNKIIASAVSGISIFQLKEYTQNKGAFIRIMPNIAAQFGESATCVAYDKEDEKEGATILQLFQNLGTAVYIEEKLMDAATVLGACGTAYALRYIRAAMQAGIEIGFDAKTALAIASQTVKGASKMALEEGIHPEQLIDRVTTPQGCTIVGLNEMEHQGFSSALIKGIKTSLQKIKE